MGTQKIFIIAEAGVNHNGSINRAKEMVKIAANAGADAVKFQTFRTEKFVTKNAIKADYQIKATGREDTQFVMLKKLELSYESHVELVHTCAAHDIEFLSSPFDLTTIDMLIEMGIKKWKIPSGEITNLPYLKKIASLGQEIILSTGMADIREIRDAVQVFLDSGIIVSQITLLHCNTEYPTPMQDVNLKAIHTLRETFPDVNIGYSDHTTGIEIPVAAVAMGAKVIEKHFTLDKNLSGPDHRASLLPNELKQMVRAIRNVEIAFGDGIKRASPSEKKNIPIARKSIVAAEKISIGEKFSEKNLTVKRPGIGLSPMKWYEIIGRRANRNYCKDELIDA